jgi:hypothetical protein
MPKNKSAPQAQGLVASAVYVSTYCGVSARTWSYHHPSDCRDKGKRIAVFMRDDRIGSTVRVIEGDGRTPRFEEHAKRILPAGATDDVAVTVAIEFAGLLTPKVAETPEQIDERLVAGILTANEFRVDDFYGQEAWVMESEIDGFTLFVRGAPDPQFVKAGPYGEIVVPLTHVIHAELPVEVGIKSDFDKGQTSCIAPCLEEGVRVILEAMLPHPSHDEITVFDYHKLVISCRPQLPSGPVQR